MANEFIARNGLIALDNSTITGSLRVTQGITGSLQGTASWAQSVISSSFANTASFVQNAISSSFALTTSLAQTASFASNADLLDGRDSTVFATTGSNIFVGNQTVTGSLFTSGSNNLVGSTTLTGSLNISGSTTQTGNNNLLGNTTLSGSIVISGSLGTSNPTVRIYGDTTHNGYIRFDPVSTNIDTSISASYIYVSGSTNDLYFSQNGSGYNNVTRLRWLEGNLYTGLLNGGIISATVGSTTYTVGSGSGIVVNLNASYNDNPYPTITYVNWPNLTASIAPLSASYDQSFVSILSNGTIFTQGIPYEDGDYNTKIPIGAVIHQNRSTVNAFQTFPGVAYGWKQRSFDFIRAFGPLKIAGYTLAPSGSSTRGLVLSGGTAFVDGRNYTIDPNNPSYIVEGVGIETSKIFRYRQSGSGWAYDTNAGAGYTNIDPTQYSLNGALTPVDSNKWSIQRVFYFPNSATKALYVYYGNAEYANEAEALAAVGVEPFSEAPNTAANAIYVGYILVRNDATFTVPASFTINQAGLFRAGGGSGAGGGGGATSLAALSDVFITSPTNAQALVYNTVDAKWENKSFISASISGNAATSTTASFAFAASIATSASFATTSSYALTAETLLGSVTSASFASTASYVLNAVSSSFATSAFTATTASYILNAVSASFAPNIYNTNGSLTGARVVNLNGNPLDISGSTTTRFFANGRVGIGTTTDGGFQLDVNGTTRLGSTLHFGGPLQLLLSSNTSTKTIGNTGTSIVIGSHTVAGTIQGDNILMGFRAGNNINSATSAGGAASNNIMIGNYAGDNTVVTGGRNLFIGVFMGSNSLYSGLGDVSNKIVIGNGGSGAGAASLGGDILGGQFWVNPTTTNIGSPDPSVAFGINSRAFGVGVSTTFKGFLPPTTTNAQRTGIGTPAIGLQVYATDATEGQYVNLSTGWDRFLTTRDSGSFNWVSSSFATTASFAISASWAPSVATPITVADEGTIQGTSTYFNFTGAGVTATVSSNTASINIPGGAGATFPFTGSAAITGSLVVTGSTTSTLGFTGSLFGTASWANNAVTSSYILNAVSSSFATTASFAVSASFAPYGGLRTKAGAVVNTSFTGNPRKATVTFTTAFPNTSYAIVVTGEDARSFTIESKLAGSFVINANSNPALAGTTYWTAIAYGETI